MNINYLPGIAAAGYCKSANLQPDVLDVIDESEKMKVYGSFTDIPITGNGSMTVKSKDVKGATIYTVTVAFQICADDDTAKGICKQLEKNIHAFIFTNINGNKLLVGTHEKPYPVVTTQYQNDDSPTGKRGYLVEVTYQNTHSYIVLE